MERRKKKENFKNEKEEIFMVSIVFNINLDIVQGGSTEETDHIWKCQNYM